MRARLRDVCGEGSARRSPGFPGQKAPRDSGAFSFIGNRIAAGGSDRGGARNYGSKRVWSDRWPRLRQREVELDKMDLSTGSDPSVSTGSFPDVDAGGIGSIRPNPLVLTPDSRKRTRSLAGPSLPRTRWNRRWLFHQPERRPLGLRAGWWILLAGAAATILIAQGSAHSLF